MGSDHTKVILRLFLEDVIMMEKWALVSKNLVRLQLAMKLKSLKKIQTTKITLQERIKWK